MIRRLDRYELLEEVGSGGMSVVYKGRDTTLDREVAVKVLHPHLAARPESRARFSREAKAVARLSHPNILEIFDFAGDDSKESYLVTEFIRGRTLKAYAEEVGFVFPEVGALVGRALADALAHAHAAGVIHRDLKPENVMIADGGGPRAVKLTDFGIAKLLTSEERMTMTGALVGSPNHMAPEIIEGKEADARADVFSLGTILYWACTGRFPFAAGNPSAILRRIVEGQYDDPRLHSPLCSDALARCIITSLSHEPANRQPSAQALRDELDAALAESGMARPDEELARFLADPAAYKKALPARLVATLGTRGEEALAAGKTAAALSFFNRVLALEPQNERVLSHLSAMARRAKLRRAAKWLALAAAGIVLLGGAAFALRGLGGGRTVTVGGPVALYAPNTNIPPRPAPIATNPKPEPTPSPVATVEPAPPKPEPKGAKTAPKAAAKRVEEPKTPEKKPEAKVASAEPAPPAAPARVTVHVKPYARRATLDGVELKETGAVLHVELVPGKPHRLDLEHPCCAVHTETLPAAEPGAMLPDRRVVLDPKPALLRVDGDEAIRIFIDDKEVGTAGESRRKPISVPIPANGPTPHEGSVTLRLELAGHLPKIRSLTLRAGAETSIPAELEAAP